MTCRLWCHSLSKLYLPCNSKYILHEIRKRKANWIGHIFRRNCLLQQVIEGKIKGLIEVIRRRGRRRKKLLNDLKDRRGYCQLKEEVLDRTTWRNRSGRGFGPVVWQITDDDDDDDEISAYCCISLDFFNLWSNKLHRTSREEEGREKTSRQLNLDTTESCVHITLRPL